MIDYTFFEILVDMLGFSKGKQEKAIFNFIYEKEKQEQEEKERVERQMKEDEDEITKKKMANLLLLQQSQQA
eukprot:CAMPEP_0170553112 /NCGR_PEP_ID=MMETSP0211-20121228/10952_1 /TAXON_ID=311385 /ORGANISM="Pseudokeronopsis sp., Strain OXSARD2" /LENGTH=71 /DNA_ID=CAMNT_0010861247 /DNA_START=556 /DNA_END=771 /DNA_ORIENTATION=-